MTPKTGILFCLMGLTALPGLAVAQGLSLSPTSQQAWSSRLTVGLDAAQPRMPVGALLSDYFFASAGRAAAGRGFRASGGVMLGAGSASLGAWSAANLSDLTVVSGLSQPASIMDAPSDLPSAQPYLGIGYSHRASDGAWGLNADLGWVAGSGFNLNGAGRALLGPHRLDEAVRNLRLQPILQLGLRYRF